MRRTSLVVLAMTLVGCLAVVAQEGANKPGEPDQDAVTRLILQLADGSFQKREEASRKLVEIGEPARRQLLKAREAPDAEVRRRVGLVLEQLDKALAERSEVHVVGLYEPRQGPFESVLPREIDYRAFCAAVTEAGAKAELTPGKRVWELLAPNVRDLVKDDKLLQKSADFRDPRSHQTLHTIRAGLNKIVEDPAFHDPRYFAGLKLDDRIEELIKRREKLSPLETRGLNRLLFAAAFPKEIFFDAELAFGEVVTVEVKRTLKPVVLVLCAYHSVRWDVKVAPGAQVGRIILSGYEPQEVTPVEAARIDDYSRGAAVAGGTYFYAYRKGDPNDREGQDDLRSYTDMVAKVRQLTGKDLDSFQGQYRYDGRPFVIGERVKVGPIPKDAEVHVVALGEAGETEPKGPKNWASFCKHLAEVGQRPELTPGKRLWEKLPEHIRAVMADEAQVKKAMSYRLPEDHGRMHAMRDTVGAAVRKLDFYQKSYFEKVAPNEELRVFLEKLPNLTPLERERFACLLLEAAFPEDFDWSVREGYTPGTAKVRVPVTEKPVILVLSAGYSIRWFIEAEPGARLHHVIVGGSRLQEVSGVTVPVVNPVADRIDGGGKYFAFPYAKRGDREDSFERAAQAVRELTGIKEIARFQGQSHWDGRPFVIGPPPKYPPVPKDAQLHVVGVPGDHFILGPWGADIIHWAPFCSKLVELGQKPEPTPAKRIWELLPRDVREVLQDPEIVRRLEEFPQPNVGVIVPRQHAKYKTARIKFTQALEQVLRRRDFYLKEYFDGIQLATDEGQDLLRRHKDLSLLETRRLNRILLDTAFPLEIRSTVSASQVPGTATVRVKASAKPIVLVLTAYDSVRWIVDAEPGAKVHQVIVGGYHAQEVSGIDAPVRYRTYEGGERDGETDEREGGPVHFYVHDREDEERYADVAAKLRRMTGLEVTSFQGREQYDGTPFVVGSRP